MQIISWSYPKRDNLRDLIEQANLHPITALTSLSHKQKQYLLNENVVLCKNVFDLDNKKAVELVLSPEEVNKLKEEAKGVCS